MTTVAATACIFASVAAVAAVANPVALLRILALGALLVAALAAGVPAVGVPAWCIALAAALWLAPSLHRRPWLAAVAQITVAAAIALSLPASSGSSLASATALVGGACMLAAGLNLATASPLLSALALATLVAPAWSAAVFDPVAIDAGEGLAAVRGLASTAATTAATPPARAWQWACAALLVGGTLVRSRGLRAACGGAAAICWAVVVAQAAQVGVWPALDLGLRAVVVLALGVTRWHGTPAPAAEPAGRPSVDALLRLAAVAVGVVAALWTAQFSSAAGPTLPHDPRGWVLAATALALLAAAVRSPDGPRAVHGALAATLIACAAALAGGAAAGWTVADLALVHGH